jgi:hypothetical protein
VLGILPPGRFTRRTKLPGGLFYALDSAERILKVSENLSFASLPPERQQLLKRMQEANFGRFESLVIRGGQPVLDPPPRLIREIKFGGENGPRPEVAIEDFALKAHVIDLFCRFDELNNGVIDVLEIKHGLPFRMIITGGLA